MKTNTMDRIRQLDKIWARECSAYLQLAQLYSGPSPFFLQEKYLDAVNLKTMAKKWVVSIEELRIFIAIQRHVNAVANDDIEGLPSEEDIADKFDLPIGEFNRYVQEQVCLIKEARVVDADEDTALWREITAEDFGDIEEDILQDAAVPGE